MNCSMSCRTCVVLSLGWLISGASAQPKPTEATPAVDFSSQVERSALRERAIEALVAASVAPEPVLRANAIEGLHPARNRAEDAVRAGLSDENAGVRFVAAYTVGKLKMRSSLAFVEPLLADSDPRVRAAAIFAHASNGRAIDPSPLGEMLHSEDPMIRAEAARILGELGNTSAIPMIKAAAALADSRNRSRAIDESLLQRERVFQLQTAEALARLGDPEARDALRAALYPSSPEGLESAALAAQILGTLKDQKSARLLVNLVEERAPVSPGAKDPGPNRYAQPKEVRLAAAAALAQLGHADGMYVAEEYFDDAEAPVRAQATFVMACGRRRADLPRLDRAMQSDPSPVVRLAAAAAILRALSESDR